MKKLTKDKFSGKVIDIHSHAGTALKSYARQEYPYAETIEGLYHKQLAAGVDVNVVFPFGPDLYGDLGHYVRTNILRKATRPLSPVPYQLENELLCREVFEFCPELSARFLPFACVHPGRDFKGQLQALCRLAETYPLYGLKVNPALCQAKVRRLLEFDELFAFAREQQLPFMFHTTSYKEEGYSYAGDVLRIVEKYPENRHCLAHCIGLHRGFLEQAAAAPNAWVDCSALKIQVQLAYENSPIMAAGKERFQSDCSDYRKVLVALAEAFPDTMLWGSDSPAYAYIVKRRANDGRELDFRLKATYADEKAAVDYLCEPLRMRVCNRNSLKFLFGLI